MCCSHSVTKLGDFWKFLSTNLFTKVAQKDWWLLGYFEIDLFMLKLPWMLFWQHWEIFGQLFYSNTWSHWLQSKRVMFQNHFNEVAATALLAVWPELAKFCHFGKSFQSVWLFWGVIWSFAKVLANLIIFIMVGKCLLSYGVTKFWKTNIGIWSHWLLASKQQTFRRKLDKNAGKSCR